MTPLADLPDPRALRRLADEVRNHTRQHLDTYLEVTADALAAQGRRLHLASDAVTAGEVVGELLRHTSGVALQDTSLGRLCLGRVLEKLRLQPAGVEHVSGVTILFPELVIAETGQVCALSDGPIPPSGGTIIAVIGFDQMLPRLADLGAVLKLVSRSSTGRPMPRCVGLINVGDLVMFDTNTTRERRRRIVELWHRLRGTAPQPPAAEDWLELLGRSLTAPGSWEYWSARP